MFKVFSGLTLHFYSSAAYKYIRKTYKHLLTAYRYSVWLLQKYWRHTRFCRRNTWWNFGNLELNLIMFFSGWWNINYTTNNLTVKQYEGLVDIGIKSNELNEIATQAYVSLLLSVNEPWKSPTAYFSSLVWPPKQNKININYTNKIPHRGNKSYVINIW